MVSYYWFQKGLGGFHGSISEFIRSPIFGISSWCKHIQAWTEKTPVEVSIDFMRYEDMKTDPVDLLTRIYKLLGYKISDDILSDSIRLSPFENMKELENSYNLGGDMRFLNFTFMRRGQSGGYKPELSPEDLSFINRVASHWITVFR